MATKPARRGTIDETAPWEVRVRSVVGGTARAVLSHGAAARWHGVDAFVGYEPIHVLCRKGWWPDDVDGLHRHATRGPRDAEVERVHGIPVLSIPAMLTLFAPVHGLDATADVLDWALRRDLDPSEIETTARRWRCRGRPGPAALFDLLAERDGRLAPDPVVRRIAVTVAARTRVKLRPLEVAVDAGRLRLDLADPARRVALVRLGWCRPDDARRAQLLRRSGWAVVELWWRHSTQPDRVARRLADLLATTPPRLR